MSGLRGWPAGDDRGQLVLVAAAVVAVALLPVVIAYTQLGYSGVATTEPTATTPEADAVDALERAAFEAAVDRQGEAAWANRSRVAVAVRDEFDDRAAAIERRDLEGGRHHVVERNATAATAWADERCPSGDGREFGACEAVAGVVLQERAGDAHVLAVAVDVRTVTEDGSYDGTYVLDAALGDGRGTDPDRPT